MNRDPLKHFMKKGDTGPPLRRTLIDAATGLPRDLTGSTVRGIMKKPDGNPLFDRVITVESPPSSGVVRSDWQAGDTDNLGDHTFEFEETTQAGEVVSYPPNRDDPARRYIHVIIGPDLG